ncbi:MAG: hypothetical protein IIA40_13770 [SAR324 cluster bacterium]|nr:hypothetical protein [SAR324 cluster bacterium]
MEVRQNPTPALPMSSQAMSRLDALAVTEQHPFDKVNRAIYRVGLGGVLPVVPPTPRRVEAMLGGRDPEILVATLPPAGAEATHRRIALCALMAGCRSEHFAVLLAAAGVHDAPHLGEGLVLAAADNTLNLDVTASATVSGMVFGVEE